MNFTVVWLPVAERELTQLYLSARDRQALTEAANRLDRGLAQLPGVVGESRFGDLRIAFDKPLGIYFHVYEKDRRVEVIHVWRY